mmetsp:Transcript_33597/g.49796  ORF Transcript_33597/g.49796 Transcript_33597/m.49796 type:complete len:241 (-) Transcript_33597:1055-1777(-)
MATAQTPVRGNPSPATARYPRNPFSYDDRSEGGGDYGRSDKEYVRRPRLGTGLQPQYDAEEWNPNPPPLPAAYDQPTNYALDAWDKIGDDTPGGAWARAELAMCRPRASHSYLLPMHWSKSKSMDVDQVELPRISLRRIYHAYEAQHRQRFFLFEASDDRAPKYYGTRLSCPQFMRTNFNINAIMSGKEARTISTLDDVKVILDPFPESGRTFYSYYRSLVNLVARYGIFAPPMYAYLES